VGAAGRLWYKGPVRKFLLFAAIVVAAAVAPVASSGGSSPGCTLPAIRPLWIDFGDGSVPFWDRIFTRPGIIAAASNFQIPPRLRAAGAKTVYWDMHLNNRVGTPTKPADPVAIADQADRLFLRAVASSSCGTPVIALNELFGAGTATPWSPSNAQYRANVLAFVKRLSGLGARPYLLVSGPPYTGGEAAQWWRDVSESADLIREVYFAGPRIKAQGALVGSRTVRVALRSAVEDFTELGIAPTHLGLMLGFHTTKGVGSGREGLQPASAWFDVVKLEALAAKQVAGETGVATVWSWGWGVWSAGENDPDKEAAACVWLWARDSRLCNGPQMAGAAFDTSRTEGRLPPGMQCVLGANGVSQGQLAAIARLTGDTEAALSALHARLVLSEQTALDPTELDAAESAVVSSSFGGSWAAYRSALARAGVSSSLARFIISTEARQGKVEQRFHVAVPSPSEVLDFWTTYTEVQARFVETRPAPWWLGGKRRGVALEATAPATIFRLGGEKFVRLSTPSGPLRVKPLGPVLPLGAFPAVLARPSISAALEAADRTAAFEKWLLARQVSALRRTVCLRDELPSPEPVDLAAFLPFLALG
jgi:hypothetical protein